MSRENVELVRAAFEAYNRKDVDAALKDVAPDITFDATRAIGIDRGVYDLARTRVLLTEFAASWESIQFEVEEFIEAGSEVITPWINHLRGRDGIEVEARGVYVWTIRDGVIIGNCLYQELPEALEAAGLRE